MSYLRKKGLIEGRKPNIYISKNLATTLGKKDEYSKHRGLDENKCNTLITSALKEHGTLTKAEITSLLGDVLSELHPNGFLRKILDKSVEYQYLLNGVWA